MLLLLDGSLLCSCIIELIHEGVPVDWILGLSSVENILIGCGVLIGVGFYGCLIVGGGFHRFIDGSLLCGLFCGDLLFRFLFRLFWRLFWWNLLFGWWSRLFLFGLFRWDLLFRWWSGLLLYRVLLLRFINRWNLFGNRWRLGRFIDDNKTLIIVLLGRHHGSNKITFSIPLIDYGPSHSHIRYGRRISCPLDSLDICIQLLIVDRSLRMLLLALIGLEQTTTKATRTFTCRSFNLHQISETYSTDVGISNIINVISLAICLSCICCREHISQSNILKNILVVSLCSIIHKFL